MAKNEPDENGKQGMNAYGKYAGLGFQMVATVGLLGYAGYRIDEHAGHHTNWVAAIFSVAGIGISLYFLIISLRR